MKNFICKEGIVYIVFGFLMLFIFILSGLRVLSVFCALINVFIIFFFRCPDRRANIQNNYIYAPADGKVIFVDEEYEKHYFQSTVNRVSIFMNVFNVHVNYAPIDGKIEYIKYSEGGFKNAGLLKLSEMNENNYIGICSEKIKIGIRQVAGFIARRIVCNCILGDKVRVGERIGLIKFGSRVDIYFPKTYFINVKYGDNVRAGKTVVARFCE